MQLHIVCFVIILFLLLPKKRVQSKIVFKQFLGVTKRPKVGWNLSILPVIFISRGYCSPLTVSLRSLIVAYSLVLLTGHWRTPSKLQDPHSLSCQLPLLPKYLGVPLTGQYLTLSYPNPNILFILQINTIAQILMCRSALGDLNSRLTLKKNPIIMFELLYKVKHIELPY